AFSSIASVLGAKEAHYAAANQFLDAFAHARQAVGLPALSVNWGPWADGGMAAAPDRTRAFRLLGLSPLRPERAFEALERLAGQPTCQATVVRADWFTLKLLYGQDGRRRLLAEIQDEDESEGGPNDRARHGRWSGLDAPPEERLARLVAFLRDRVAEVLRIDPERIDPERPLNSLGLDSLMAIELKSGVEAELGTTLPLSVLMQGPTLVGLAAEALGRLSGSATAPASAPSTAGASEPMAEHPLSIGQRSLWYVHQLDPAGTAYNIAGAARVRAAIDVDALRRSFQRLVDRHAMLRTTFAAADGPPVQRVHRRGEAWFHVEDGSGWSEAERNRRLVEEANRPFDLERGPLFRAYLFTRSAEEHDLLLSVHHIVSDFWSIAVLMHELGVIYPAERSGREPNLPPIERPYTDYVRWQAEMLAGPEGERLWDYWRRQLGGPLPALDLPTDRPRPAVQTYRGASKALHLDARLSERLLRLGASHGSSLYVTLLAAFQVLLARYTGQDDLIVGSPVAGRNGPKFTEVVGYFVNPLPIRAKLAGNPTFLDILGQVRQAVLDGLEHQDFPFASMVDRLQIERDPSRSPLFQAMFVYQKAQRLDKEGLTSFALRETGPRMDLGGFPLESLALEQQAAQFDLTMMAAEADGRLAASLEYNVDLFDAATIDRLLANFQTLLEGIVARPDRPIADLPLLAEAERRRVLFGWNATRAEAPRAATIQELFEAQVERTPEAAAVAFEGERLTYRELDRRANQLAHYLRKRGVAPEVRVGLCVPRSVEMIVGIMGILKAGGAYVPLDPDYPADRLAFLLADARVAVLLTQESLRAALPDAGASVVCFDADAESISREGEARTGAVVAGESLAYVIFTSGSTGRPKGVMVSQRNLVHSTHARFLSYREPVRGFLLVSSFAFDSSVAGLFWTLCQGGVLVLPPRAAQSDPHRLSQLMSEHQVSHILSIPSLYGLLLDEAPTERLESLRTAIVAGEPCPRALIESHRAKLPRTELFNEYGPTEATVWCSLFRCRTVKPRGSVPIGRPIADTQMYVLDARLRPVPIGVTGELYIGGPGLARGYWDRPALTAERFLPDPFSGTPGGRLYKTGDLARWRSDGEIEFLGRADDQVKIRGYRIEPGEIEAALLRHPAVREAVAVAREDTPGDPRLVAYIVPVDPTAPEAADLRPWLKRSLPDYMVPSAFVTLRALPLSPNGKVDQKALPAPSTVRPGRERALVAP
ncbi:MAG TPA: amino acid adenylation domain-containing protein, partial [Isosphaeraceae bacterium]|nr:amino acid adenylation domain-containing protein [Isosphaeraceae bacterium]